MASVIPVMPGVKVGSPPQNRNGLLPINEVIFHDFSESKKTGFCSLFSEAKQKGHFILHELVRIILAIEFINN
jgi:hypothetical protein